MMTHTHTPLPYYHIGFSNTPLWYSTVCVVAFSGIIARRSIQTNRLAVHMPAQLQHMVQAKRVTGPVNLNGGVQPTIGLQDV